MINIKIVILYAKTKSILEQIKISDFSKYTEKDCPLLFSKKYLAFSDINNVIYVYERFAP